MNAALEIARNIGRVPRRVNRKKTAFPQEVFRGFGGTPKLCRPEMETGPSEPYQPPSDRSDISDIPWITMV